MKMPASSLRLWTLNPASQARSRLVHDWIETMKPRIVFLASFTTVCGYYLASRGPLDTPGLFHTLLAMILVSAGAAALNQYMERDTDALMERTCQRPLPAGRLSPAPVLVLGSALALAGVLDLALGLNLLAGTLGAVALASYLLLYTPMKRKSAWCTLVGAVPGALPPVIGWAAARASLDFGAYILFTIMFLWQLPHFMAIGWLYRKDYERARMPMLAVIDADGRSTARQALVYSSALLVASFYPAISGLCGNVYLAGAIAAGLLLTGFVLHWYRLKADQGARQCFGASLVYLAVIFTLIVLDKRV